MLCLLLGAPALPLPGAVTPETAPETEGVVVEWVEEGSPAAAAGLEPGDLLRTWERAAAPPHHPQPAAGTFRTPFDLDETERNQGARGPVVLTGDRAGRPITATVTTDAWGLKVRPRMPAPLLEAYQEGRREVQAGAVAPGTARWREAAATALAGGDPALAGWLLLQSVEALWDRDQWEQVRDTLNRVIQIGETADDLTLQFQGWETRGLAFRAQKQYDRADPALREALRLQEEAGGLTLRSAVLLNILGTIRLRKGDLDAAEADFLRSLAIKRAIVPDSLTVANSLNNLGTVAWGRGDLDRTEQYLRDALAIRRARDPDSLSVAASLNNLGAVVKRRGDLAGATDLYRQSLALKERLAPDSFGTAATLNNLATLATDRGDLAAAEAYHRRALALKEALGVDRPSLAITLHNLGLVAKQRHDLDGAEAYFRRAGAIWGAITPDGAEMAANLEVLGQIARRRGDLAAAAARYREALAIAESLNPDSMNTATILSNLANLALDRDASAEAEPLYRRALAILRSQAPDSTHAADVLHNLGLLHQGRGETEAAERSLRDALTINQRLAPDSAAVAESLHALGRLSRETGRAAAAADFLRRAIDALEAQRGRLGGSDRAQAGFAARYAPYYRAYIDLLIELGRPAEAFHVLERSQARSLLAMLAERDLVFTADLPRELERRRRIAGTAYDRVQAELGGLTPSRDAEEITRLHETLIHLRQEQEALQQAVRAAAPRLAALQYPKPVTLAQARTLLDPGTLLLAFSVGAHRTHLFRVGPRPRDFVVRSLAVGEAALHAQVQLLRSRITRRDPKARETAAELGAALLGADARRIGKARRLLIVPDGPLHLLPFAALPLPGRRTAEPRWLGAVAPLHRIVSTTVYAELRATRRPAAAPRVVAFGDPHYPAHAPALLRGGAHLAPLPATRAEVAALQALYPHTTAFLGPRATEERAKALPPDASLIHFACHGLVDDRFPLDSALALSIPDSAAPHRDNGLLQAWEIFETLRVNADLVTLSACDTARGQTLAGEGIVGLSRAFQYAGARSLLVSLWPIPDASTARFMQTFYTTLQAGAPKDVALQRAQAALRREQASAAPYYWAPFVLIGDWQ